MNICMTRLALAKCSFGACRTCFSLTLVSFVISDLDFVNHIYRRAPSSGHDILTCRKALLSIRAEGSAGLGRMFFGFNTMDIGR